VNDEKQPVAIFVCPPTKCRCECPTMGECEHIWDGPEREFAEGRGSSATCSRCGMMAVEHSMWSGP